MRKLIDHITAAIGRLNDWVMRLALVCVLLLVLNVFAVSMLRYIFGIGKPWMQELYVGLHAAVFMLGIGYTLSVDEHVRIDLIYREAPPRYRAWVNLLGNLFIGLPFVWLLSTRSWPFVERSFRMAEKSAEAGGLPALYLIKGLLLALCFFLGLQIIANALKAIGQLIDLRVRPTASSPPTFLDNSPS